MHATPFHQSSAINNRPPRFGRLRSEIILPWLTLSAVLAGFGFIYARSAPPTMLRHVVLFQFKDGASDSDRERVIQAFRELPKKISEVDSFEYGTDVSPEKLADGFTHCFLLTFRSDADRDAYLQHPEHKVFAELAIPNVEKVLVVDFWSKN